MRFALPLIALTFAASATRSADAGTCARLLQHAKSYLTEVRESHGLRLALKATRDDPIASASSGFVAEANPNARLWSWAAKEFPLRALGIRDRQLTPLRGLHYTLFVRPTSSLTAMAGLGRREPTLPVMIIAGVFAWQGIDAGGAEIYDREVAQQAIEHGAEYDHMIQSDYRFNQIREDLELDKIDPNQARTRAYWRKQNLDRYYLMRAGDGQKGDLESEKRYLPFFGHLTFLFEAGVRDVRGFDVPPTARGPLSEAQQLELIRLNHVLYATYQLVIEMVGQTPTYQTLRQQRPLAQVLGEIENAPFTKQVLDKLTTGTISRAQATRILQEEAFWRVRFQEWRTIGVRKYRTDPRGQPTNDVLTLSTIREEIWASLGDNNG